MRSFREVRIHRVGFAGLVALVIAAQQASAATNVAYTLEMGGDNHAAAYHAGPIALSQIFTSGSTADGQVFGQGGLVTWGVRIALMGTHAGVTNPGTQYAPNGVANFVFDLELHSSSAAGPLVTTAQFQSTILNGTAPDNLTAYAMFALSFQNGGNGPARVVDPLSGVAGLKGGLLCGGVDNSADKLKSATYPTPEPGKLVGMGAGYNAWKACCGAAQTTPGLGLDGTTPSGSPGALKNTVICEGQIGNLALGTYVLKLVPAAGNNVLRGDVNLAVDQNSFAVAADGTTGDTITFVVGNPFAGKATNPNPANNPPPIVTLSPITLSWTAGANATTHDVYFGTTCPPTTLVSAAQAGTSYPVGVLATGTYCWRIDEHNIDNAITTGDVWTFDLVAPATVAQWRSVRSHGPAGDVGIVLNSAVSSGPNLTTEPRQGGIRLIEIDLSRPCGFFDEGDVPVAIGSDSNTYPPSSTAWTNGDQTLQLYFSAGLPDQLCYTINLGTKVWDFETSYPVGGDVDCVVRGLYGDANPTAGGVVNLSDSLVVQARASTSVALSPWADLDESGAIDSADAMAAKSQIGHSVCP